MDKQNIIDYGILAMNMEDKRRFFYILDHTLKMIHQKGGYVSNLQPSAIFINSETATPVFEHVYPLQSIGYAPDDLKKMNLLWLADLAFCSYLPEYDLNSGLLNLELASSSFEAFKSYFPEQDIEYYQSILVGYYQDPTAPVSYYSDYVNKQQVASNRNTGSNLSYIKSTPEGKAMYPKDEAAYTNYILLISAVCSMLMLGILAGVYLLEHFG